MTPQQALSNVITSSGQLQGLWFVAQSQVAAIPQNDICYGLGYPSLVSFLQQISTLACKVAQQAVMAAQAYATRCGTTQAWAHVTNAQNAQSSACTMNQFACHMGEFAGDPFGQVYQTGNPSGYCANYHYVACVGAQVSAALSAYSEAVAAAGCQPLAPPPQVTLQLPHPFYNIFRSIR
jgi:hypothetical protein